MPRFRNSFQVCFALILLASVPAREAHAASIAAMGIDHSGANVAVGNTGSTWQTKKSTDDGRTWVLRIDSAACIVRGRTYFPFRFRESASKIESI
jgi:hypothetical protein